MQRSIYKYDFCGRSVERLQPVVPLIRIDKESNTNLVVDVRYRSTTTGYGGTARQITYTATGVGALNDNAWHHFVVTFQGTNGSLSDQQDADDLVRMYVDGAQLSTAISFAPSSGSVEAYDHQIDTAYSYKGFSPSNGGIPQQGIRSNICFSVAILLIPQLVPQTSQELWISVPYGHDRFRVPKSLRYTMVECRAI